jgi:hypothetical protein
LDTHPAAKLFRDPEHLGQAEAGPITDLLRREEWLENLV